MRVGGGAGSADIAANGNEGDAAGCKSGDYPAALSEVQAIHMEAVPRWGWHRKDRLYCKDMKCQCPAFSPIQGTRKNEPNFASNSHGINSVGNEQSQSAASVARDPRELWTRSEQITETARDIRRRFLNCA
jgi:hypothetical protein